MSEKKAITFGKRVRAIRKRLELTQTEFCRGVGISIQHLSDIELDKKKPCHDFFYNMGKAFKVNLNWLVLGEGETFLGEKGLTSPRLLKTGNPDVDNFLKHFFTSDIVKFDALLSFSKLQDTERRRFNGNFPEPEDSQE
jgi:transcriptional regulator with XRE-family HTH domain